VEMKLKKIIIVYPSFERGGVENILVNLINELVRKKILIEIITISNKLKNSQLLKPSKYLYIHCTKMKKIFFLSNRINLALQAAKLLIKSINKTNHKSSIIFSMQSSMIPILISKFYKIKIVARNAEDPISSFRYSGKKIYSSVIFLLRFLIYNLSDGIITNSYGSKKSLGLFLLNKKKICAIYNPYLKKINVIKKNIKKKQILAVGRFCRQKNFEFLIKAFDTFSKKKPNYKLMLLGDGEYRQRIKKLIISLNLSKKIVLKGWVKDTNKFFLESKLFIIPSLYEGLGNVVIDALNNNTPVIASKCKSGPREIIKESKGGYLVDVNNLEQTADKMNYCIDNYKEAILKTKYGRLYLNRFLIKKGSELYLNFLNKVLTTKKL
tara:strand:+ start:225 stop:1367 length:1143 start_codon:yes stop_codon:yes gene_type:complete